MRLLRGLGLGFFAAVLRHVRDIAELEAREPCVKTVAGNEVGVLAFLA